MKKVFILVLGLLIFTGCSIVRIDTSSIDNILNVILTKDNKLYNQIGQGYKYYLPGGVSYIDSDDLNDILYCNGIYYYLYIDAISYYYDINNNYVEDDSLYYSKKMDVSDGYKYSGYLQINKKDNLYYIEFIYNHARIEAVVDKKHINETILNSSYILSTMKYNHDIVEIMLDDDYFTNKTGKYNNYNSKDSSEKFVLENESVIEEG